MGAITLRLAAENVRRDIVEADRTKAVSIVQVQEPELRSANAGRILHHALEYRLQVRPATN